MKSALLFLSFLPAIVFSQITLSNSDFADGGDTVRMSTATDLTIDYTTTGASSTWDYSTLTPTGQELKEYNSMSSAPIFVNIVFGAFAASDYQATNYASSTAIPLGQIGGFLPVNITDVFQYSKNSADSITSVGFALAVDGNDIPFKSDTIETRYKFPLTFNDSYYSRGYSKLDMNPFYNGIWIQYRQRTSNVDGWGSITTPYGTFDAVRIDHFITETDSLYMDIAGGFWVELPIPDAHIYEWWTNGEKEPILRITTSLVLGNETVTDIEYRDNYLGLDAAVEELSLNFSIYPNPAENEIHLNDLPHHASYYIASIDGKVVQSGSVSSIENMIDISQLAKGTYELIISTKGVYKTSSFVKK
jgi:Secretion system C-terminal sorting domain